MGVVVLVAAGVAAAVGLSTDNSSTAQSTAATTSSSATSSSAPTTRVVPSQVLPSEQQMKQVTLFDLAKHGDVDTTVAPDGRTDPPACSLVSRPAGTSVVGRAISVAGLNYRDKPGDDYGATAFAYVAVFDSAEAADAAQQKLAQAVHNCTKFSNPEANKPDAPPLEWTVSNVNTTDHQVVWNTDQQTDDGTPWSCAKTARTRDNLLVLGMLCAPNPADGPNKIIDVIFTNIDAKK
ncbi:sensor domain-containing protein [uncultured Mycobacterium sp.]|uniref:sensor domain-containing protein n=1 Tax=uncultured Mycobacterium sp. TaxID=171292 RepID=UPI0035C94D4D